MRDELSVFITDAWVEAAGTQNGAAYQGFPYFICRARENGIPIESVVHKMTGKTAARFGISERGLLKEGYFADLTVFDPDSIKVDPSVPDFTPQGIRYVVIGGNMVVDRGEYIPMKPGVVVLRRKTPKTDARVPMC